MVYQSIYMEIKMQLKKTIRVVTLLLLASISITAKAGLETWNYTHEDSSVAVVFEGTTKPPRCSSEAGVYTPKMNADGSPGFSSVRDNEITLLCRGSVNNHCYADIFSSNNCSGASVGHASLNLKTKSVESVKSTPNSKYVFTVDGGGKILSVRYAS